jgi:hypothetical protein
MIVVQKGPLKARGEDGMREFRIKDFSESVKVHGVEGGRVSE